MTIHIKQKVSPKGKDWWDWSVWLEGDKKDLDAMDQVTYTLHPTFSVPVVTVTNRKTGFRLDSSGWGEFMIYLELKTKDGRVKKRQHYLRFSDSAPKKGPSVPVRRTTVVEKAASPPTVFVSGGTRDIDTVQTIREVLSRHDIKVVGAQDIKPGQEVQRRINSMIEHAVAAVFVISGRTNLWMNEEIKAAVDAGVPHILPIVVGQNVELPEALRDYQAVKVENPLAVEDVADAIVSHSLGKGQ